MDGTDNKRQRITELLQLYSDLQATPAQEQEFFELINLDEDEEIIRDHIEQILTGQTHGGETHKENWEELYRKIIENKQQVNPRAKAAKRLSLWWYAAATVALLAGIGYYLWSIQPGRQSQQNLTLAASVAPVSIAPPASANAVLTLANGQKIVLDSTGNGAIAQQGATDIVKLSDGQIVYRGQGGSGYNMLNNPRGSRVINVRLSDGTKVWLNVASSIRYPVVFTGKERRVEIAGEAYFEVAHNASQPFVVQKGTTEVKVLGTHFNVEAYDDEADMAVTLLEGSVSVASAARRTHPTVITPGSQAQVAPDGSIATTASVDLNRVMAWTGDMFSFKGADIGTIMRQVSRWYDVEVIYKEPVKEKFFAEVPKNTNVSMLLDLLEATRAVKFEMVGKTIVVTAP